MTIFRSYSGARSVSWRSKPEPYSSQQLRLWLCQLCNIPVWYRYQLLRTGSDRIILRYRYTMLHTSTDMQELSEACPTQDAAQVVGGVVGEVLAPGELLVVDPLARALGGCLKGRRSCNQCNKIDGR